jgi:amino acid transporter
MTALGEMAAWIPHGSGFAGYATRFCDPALGFALGWTYWCKYIITTPNQLTASALIIQEWVPATKVNPGIFILIFLALICAINYFGIKFFGELEFWLSSIKVIVIVGVIILSFLLAVGAGPGPATGFKYYKNPGAFRPYITKGDTGKFYGFWSSLVNAVFAYLGTELIGVTVGEAQNPRKTVSDLPCSNPDCASVKLIVLADSPRHQANLLSNPVLLLPVGLLPRHARSVRLYRAQVRQLAEG